MMKWVVDFWTPHSEADVPLVIGKAIGLCLIVGMWGWIAWAYFSG